MLLRLLSILLLTFFSTSFSVEISDVHFDSVAEQVEADCTECDDKTCHDDADCCEKMCSCHSTFFADQRVKTKPNSYIYNVSHYRIIYSNYRSPTLDPSLKPPLFS